MVVVVGIAGLVTGTQFLGKKVEPFTGPTWTVAKEKLQLTIVERGTLESAENSEIVCRVKAGKSSSTVSSTIKWVIDDGTHVKRGQKLVELDDSGLEEQLKAQNITLDSARAAFIGAEENLSIVLSQNLSEIETAKIAIHLAELDLKKYIGEKLAKVLRHLPDKELVKFLVKLGDLELGEYLGKEDLDQIGGEYFQTRNDIEGRIEIARSDREMWLDRASWAQRMVKRGYVSKSQAEADRARLDSAEFTLKKTRTELDTLKKFILPRTVVDLVSKVREAERALIRVNTQAKANETKAQAELQSKRSIFQREEARRIELEDEIKKCQIYSPQDGLVVYYVSEQSRYGSGSQQSIVAQGEPVREGQKLMRIPDLTKMLVNVRVHEAMVSHLRGEVTRSTGFSDVVRGTIWFTPFPLERLVGQALFPELRDTFRVRDQVVVYPGQRAIIRIEASSNQEFQGHVKSVANVASQTDFWSDVKVYQTVVAIDGSVANLKPGFSAEVTIFAEETPTAVLTIPIQSVVGTIAMGKDRKCFVVDDNGQPQERDILLGMSNEKMVEIRKGLAEGEKVVLNPRPLLVGDKAHLKPAVVKSKRGAGNDNDNSFGGEDKKPGEGKKGKKGATEGTTGKGFDKAKAEEMLQKFQQASPAERKAMLDKIPEQFRDATRKKLEAQGLKIGE